MKELSKAVEKYLMTSFNTSGIPHRLSMEHVGSVGDTEQWLITLDNMCTRIFVPSDAEDGLLRRNGSLFASVIFGCPPLSADKRTSVLSVDVSASQLSDFSSYKKGENKITTITPLAASLMETPGDVENLWDWIYIPLHIAIVEMVNLKAYQIALRAQRPGVQSIDSIARSVHTLINAYLRYHTNAEDPSISADEADLTAISTVDKEGIVVFDASVVTTNFREDTPIDFMTTSQSKPIIIARLKDGVTLDGVRLKGTPTFPYCKWRRGVVGVKNDDPRRVIVSRSCARALRLSDPDTPWVTTEHPLDIDTISLPGVRVTHPLTYEDGIIVSRTAAQKLGAFKHYVDRVVVQRDALTSLTKSPLELDVASSRELFQIVKAISLSKEYNESPYVVYPTSTVAIVECKNSAGEVERREIRAAVPTKSVFMRMETHEFVNDLGIDMLQLVFKYLTFLPLEVGDKLADLHGNKSTVSAIWEDSDMPLWTQDGKSVRVHYIASPWVGKRLAVGAAIEDALAFKGFTEGTQIVVDSNETLTLDWAYSQTPFESMCGTLIGRNMKPATGVPLSLRRIARLDNNVAETLTIYRGIHFDEDGNITSSNPKMWVEMPVLMAKKCTPLLNFFLRESRVHERLESLKPLLAAIDMKVPENAKKFTITRRIPREYFASVGWNYQHEVFEGTAADKRLSEGYYGIIRAGRYKLVVPPHTPVIQAAHGLYYISKIAVEANRVVADVESESRGYCVSSEAAIGRYLEFLGRLLVSKDGRVRDIFSPRAPYAIRSVVVNSNYHDPHTVFVPKRAMRALLNDERFAHAYENCDVIEAIIKRDPVHYDRHVVGVKVREWDHKAIGVHPALISELDGDYDGDTVTVMFPLTNAGISNLRLKDAKNLAKPVEGVDLDYVSLALEHHAWKPSHFLALHEKDKVKNTALYEQLVEGNCSLDEYITAVRDFRKIKDGTAFTGALGLAIVFSTEVSNTEELLAAMSLYHKLAQDTLDAKSSGSTPSLRIVEAVASLDEAKALEAAECLELSESEINVLRKWFARVKAASKKRSRPTPPVYGVTQRSAKFVDVRRFIEYVGSGITGTTVLEMIATASPLFGSEDMVA